jgi:hypothetical protein
MARRSHRWRDVGFAGMSGGDGTALVMITHDGVDQREVVDVPRRRWPEVVVKTLEQEQPAVAMTAEDAAALGWCRHSIEPLRVVVHAPARSAGRLGQRRANARFLSDRRGWLVLPIDSSLLHLKLGGRALHTGDPGLTTDIGQWLHRSDLFTNPPR